MTRAMKPKINRAGDSSKSQTMDQCQTPAHAILPLLPYLNPAQTLWESACGKGNLVQAFKNQGFSHIIESDVLSGDEYNFLTYNPTLDPNSEYKGVYHWWYQITNPPYSIKYKWMKRSYELGKPFALLIPVESIGAKSCQTLWKQYEHKPYRTEIILLNKRINFEMPNKGLDGKGAQFPVLWYTYGLNLPKQINFYEF